MTEGLLLLLHEGTVEMWRDAAENQLVGNIPWSTVATSLRQVYITICL